jgi:hemoglobin-like flavoprotein
MSVEEIALFNDSLERCTANRDFLDHFYRTFIGSSPEVAEKFKHTDFERQTILLKISLYMMMLAAMGKSEANVHLERIAEVHSRKGHDIRPELYDLWLDCLVRTVEEFDPSFSANTERAWRNMMAPGIEFMKSRY